MINTKITYKHVLIALLVLLLVGIKLFVSWANDVSPANDIAMQALNSDEQVTVKEEAGLITFQPVDVEPETGFILYPGGRVDYRAYAPVLHQIAAKGYFVALVRVRLNLAFFDINAADRVIDLYPDIQNWAIGGHSLGGVAASSYVSKNVDNVDGLVLWASYPANDKLANADISAISIYGTEDMAGMEPFDKSRAQLPADTEFVVIEGGNHGQFGSYGHQVGDNPATISAEEQWKQIAEATAQFLESLSQ